MDLAGNWQSTYTYTSDNHEYQSTHTVALEQKDQQIAGKSLPADKRDSELHIQLTLRGKELYGRWQEKTESAGTYQGAVFDGMLHLAVSPDGDSLTGKWTGLSRHNVIKSGDWIFRRID